MNHVVWLILAFLVMVMVVTTFARVQMEDEDFEKPIAATQTTARPRLVQIQDLKDLGGYSRFQKDPTIYARRTPSGTLIPLTAHLFDTPEYDHAARLWANQGWQVKRWPRQPFEDEWAWMCMIVYEQGGLFTRAKPSETRSLRNYLIYRGYDDQIVFFKTAGKSFAFENSVVLSMAGHEALRRILENGRQDRDSMQTAKILDFKTYFM